MSQCYTFELNGQDNMRQKQQTKTACWDILMAKVITEAERGHNTPQMQGMDVFKQPSSFYFFKCF